MLGDLQGVRDALADDFFIGSEPADVTAEMFRAEDLLQRDAEEVALGTLVKRQHALEGGAQRGEGLQRHRVFLARDFIERPAVLRKFGG